MKNKILPIIICGGSGSRLWPLSRKSFPKQFLSTNSKDSFSFLQNTINRIKNNSQILDPILICNEEHRFIVAEQMRVINIRPKSIILEPIKRNTAPAITIGVLKSLQKNNKSKIENDPILLVLPADHIIKNEKEFLSVINKAINYAMDDNIVIFGIKPDHPETGYGYIESENIRNNNNIAKKVVRFVEKPNLELAKKLVKEERYLWNSGIFMFNAKTFLSEIEKYCPNILKNCRDALSSNLYDMDFERLDNYSFSKCDDISIDKALMEKTSLGIVLDLEAGWSDVGSWDALWKASDKDVNGNFTSGKVILENVHNSYLNSSSRLITGIGLKNLIIIETPDAILVASRESSQEVKKIVEKLNSISMKEALTHKEKFRPWGSFNSIAEGENWQVKKIIVKPKEAISLQLHRYRTEYWIVVAGRGLVEKDNKKFFLNKNESTFIPCGTMHRLTNPGNDLLILIEVQSGKYLGEDDIERFDDKYGRVFNN